jgi:iron complex transport system substrate-binding protein
MDTALSSPFNQHFLIWKTSKINQINLSFSFNSKGEKMKPLYKKLIPLFILITIILTACGTTPTDTPADTADPITITDAVGREVTLSEPADAIVAIGPGALRLYVYAGNLDYVVGVEQMETGDVSGKPYMLANPQLAELPVIGQGGPNNAPDAEAILTVAPDVIFSTYATDPATADELQKQTGIPVIALSYGGFGITSIFGETIQNSLSIIGQAIADPTQADQTIALLQSTYDDLSARTSDIPAESKPTVYVGGLGSRGAHGIESTQAQYALLDVINAINVVDETEQAGSIMIDKEKLLEWNPDYIFIDQGGFASVQEDQQKNPEFYQALAAIQNGNVYSQLPYNYYSTNLDTAIADAYYLGKTIYPDAFADIDPIEKADEIYTAFLGTPVYQQMAENFGGFGPIEFE